MVKWLHERSTPSGEDRSMTPSECMRVLELPSSASLDEVKHAYRRLAQQYHPDKHPTGSQARERFIRISEAYRLLTRVSRMTRSGRQVGSCSKCNSFGEVVRNMEGNQVCPRCALGCRQRFLPLPVMVIVRCTIPLILLALAAYLLWGCIDRPSLEAAGAAFVLSMAGLLSLAIICFRVRHCLPPPGTYRRRGPYSRA
jgi:hypothetical protein